MRKHAVEGPRFGVDASQTRGDPRVSAGLDASSVSTHALVAAFAKPLRDAPHEVRYVAIMAEGLVDDFVTDIERGTPIGMTMDGKGEHDAFDRRVNEHAYDRDTILNCLSRLQSLLGTLVIAAEREIGGLDD